ncbi:c-type cytochrome [Algihabitans albus]|uniref:c-type cytochrome n=1 Tax=Algihabitans albus TaxID=2164067 RepID=UPI000E5CA3AE|nr:cytochrome c [Algihabitans albus]
MTGRNSRLLLSAVVAASIVAAGGFGALASDAEDAVKYRQGVFQGLKWNIGPLAAMAKGEMAFDAAEVELRSQRIANLSTTIVEGFPEGSDMIADSDALPEIWEDKDVFMEKATALGEAATDLSSAAPTLDAGGLGPMVGAIGQACKACHDDFRAE